MQSYTEIPSSQSLQSSLALLLNNDKTTLSCSSGSAFPNTNLQVGMLCFRTDQNKLYILKDATPTWMLLLDLTTAGGAAVTELVSGVLLRKSAGTEGGDLRLEKPDTGSTLVGNLVIDLLGDKLRIFDSAGTNKGFFIDLPTGAASAATKIWHGANDGAGSGLDADLLDGMQSGNASGNIPVSNGTVNTNLNADMVDGKHVGNGSGNVPLSNGTVNTDLNADTLDGFHAASFVRTIQGVAPDGDGNVVVNLASKVSKSGDTMTGALNVSGTGLVKLDTTGDIICYRTGGTTGVIFLNQAANRYLYWDGTNYNMPGGNLIVNGQTVWHTGNWSTVTSAGWRGQSSFYGGHGSGNSTMVPVVTGLYFDAYGRVSGYTAGTVLTVANCCS